MRLIQGIANSLMIAAYLIAAWLIFTMGTAKAAPPVARNRPPVAQVRPPVAQIQNCGCDRAGCPSCSGCIGSCGIRSTVAPVAPPVIVQQSYRSFTQGTTQATTAPVVVPPSIIKAGVVQYGEHTTTLAPAAVQYGITSGCAGGNCPAQQTQSRGLFWRFR